MREWLKVSSGKKIETHNAHRVDKVTEAKWGLNDETHSTHTKKAHRATHNSTLTVMNVRALSLPIFENNYAKLTRSKIYYTTNNPAFELNSLIGEFFSLYSSMVYSLTVPLYVCVHVMSTTMVHLHKTDLPCSLFKSHQSDEKHE